LIVEPDSGSVRESNFQQELKMDTRVFDDSDSDEAALERMRDGLKPVMCSQLLIDVMEMIT
jgi:hypothetical protein